MALIQCPECERQVSDAAKSCPQCGYPITGIRSPAAPVSPPSPVQPTQPEPPPEDPRKPATWCCEKCGTVGNFVSYEMLHKQGTHDINAEASTVGVTSGLNVGIASTLSTGKQQSQLAAQLRPPVFYGRSVGCLGLTCFLVAATGGFVLLGVNGWLATIFAATFGGAGWFFNEKHEKEQAERERDHVATYAEWQRKYMCMVCGATRSLPA